MLTGTNMLACFRRCHWSPRDGSYLQSKSDLNLFRGPFAPNDGLMLFDQHVSSHQCSIYIYFTDVELTSVVRVSRVLES